MPLVKGRGVAVTFPQEIGRMRYLECECCGELTEHGICECCEHIKNHPEVQRNEREESFWLAVEIDALEQAAEQNMFLCRDRDLKNAIYRKNKQLKRRT